MEADDEGLLVGGEVAALDVRAEVVDPAEAAALAAAEQPGLPRQRAPVGVAVLPDVGRQPLVLLGAPRAPPQPLLLAARCPPIDRPGSSEAAAAAAIELARAR